MMSLIMAIVFFIAMFLGAPLFMSLLLSVIIPLVIIPEVPLYVVIQKIFTSLDSYSLMAIPFFMIAGSLLGKGGVSKRLVDLAEALFGWLPGGLAIVTFVASAFFGAISGSSIATVAAIGSIMLPSLRAAGYDLKFSLATIASAGYLGVIVPPSIPMVIYANAANTSVGAVFAGGFIPAILLIIAQGIYSFWYGKKYKIPTTPFKLNNVWKSFKKSILALLMPAIILGGIYSGVFTATESAAVSVIYGLFLSVFIYKEVNFKGFFDIMRSSVINSAVLMMIISAATVAGYILTRDRIPAMAAEWLVSFTDNTVVFMIMANILMIVFGTFMDAAPAVQILTPILAPALAQYGINPVAFGVIMIVNNAIGIVTPPVGLNLNVAANLAGVSIDMTINRHLWLYMLAAIIVLILISIFPQIIMWLPNL
ncbi:MAG: TRAP transporter large permease, partial [Clostridia bacterium]|nr:TRAP transporter large permease [Clostridia bacterium]